MPQDLGLSLPLAGDRTHDGLNRTTAGTGLVAEAFTLDGPSNLTGRAGTAPARPFSYDQSNRLTSDGARAYTWSPADRLTNRGSDTFGYDPLGRQTASTVSGTARTYAYNADGRLQSRTQGSTTSFLWDPTSAVARLVKAGSDQVVYGLGPLYLVRADGTTVTLARDGQKSVRAELDDAGAVLASFRYTAYGELQAVHPGAATPTFLGYNSQLRDGSGLIYLRARWYEPTTGRFTTRDPLHGSAASPATLNAFAYGGGNPITLSDPSGLAVERDGSGRGDCDRTCLKRSSATECSTCGVILNAIDWALFGAGSSATIRQVEDITVVTDAGGVFGLATRALNLGSNNTVTWSANLITSTTTPDPRLMQHEMGHVAQARQLGPIYLPTYVAMTVHIPGVLLASHATGRGVTVHDAHPFERDADLRAGLSDPWRR